MESLLNRSWAEVNLDSIANNVKLLKKTLKWGVEIMGVVKADAYGHGTRETVPILIENGVTRLAVSTLDEAIELRKNHITIPILVLSYTDPGRAKEIISYNIIQTVYSDELAIALSKTACEMNREVRIHIKVDTGMGRVGFMAGFDAVKSIIRINQLSNVVIEGIYTHFACADEEDKAYTEMQFEKFMSICSELERMNIQIPIKHVCNSAATIRFPQMHLDMVRVGILLYGMSPSVLCDVSGEGFEASMSLKTNVILVKKVESGQSISYGRTFTTATESLIATIPIGYADGYTRLLSNRAQALIDGQLFPVVGNICMDTCMLDITEQNGNIQISDEVVLFGKQQGKEISVDQIANLMGTINYEVTCLIGRRIPRAYIKNNELIKVQNYLLQ